MFGSDHILLMAIVLILAVVFLGPKRLPEAGRSLGQAIRGFKRETQGMRDEVSSIKEDTENLRQEMTGMKESVHSAVHEAVS
ncbi:MAG TPA: twin-arginine translocase TatA/TatE family subunit, partial [Chloroflexota bacterium]|nr:twin-arginine translocase TatA/TatE family subunit [Chloroflexota bacterium]